MVATAETISVAEASNIASRFLPAATTSTASEAPSLELRSTISTEEGTPAVYLFDINRGSSFVLVAGDDKAANPVLGYGDNLSTGSIPPQMQYMLEQYAAEMSAAPASVAAPASISAGLPSSVEPLLGDNQWGQTSPFNGMTPESNGQHTVVGCVATSTSQVMRYWSYPAQGTGSYNYRYNGVDYIGAKFGETTYNWNEMPMRYGADATDAQKEAVATLMYQVGVSVNMQYGLSESSAYGTSVIYALTDNFGYDKGTRLIQRAFFTNAMWEQTLRQELAAGRPVIYSGQSTEGGHQFVCDGYNAEGYFHFNWGWNGNCNGYFLVSALVPDGVGTGGYAEGYNYNQTAIIGMQPDKGHGIDYALMTIGQNFSMTDSNNYNIYLAGYTFHTGEVSIDFGFMVSDSKAPVVNAGRIAKVTSYTVKPTVAMRGSGQIYQKKIYNGAVSFNAARELGLSDGDYYVFPVFRPAGSTSADWQIVPVKKQQSIHIRVAGGNTTAIADAASAVELDSFSAPAKAYVGQKATFTATLTSVNGEFDGVIGLDILDGSNNVVASAGTHMAALVENRPQEFSLVAQLPQNIATGEYTVRLKAAGQAIGYSEVTVASAAVALNEVNFPEYAILAAAQAYDTDNNGILSDEELSKVTRLNLAGQDLYSAESLSHFYNLQVLNVSDNNLTALDLSTMPSLISLQADNNRLMSLNASAARGLVVLKVANNDIDNLDVNTLSKLKTLDITNNPIAGINLTGTDALTSFSSDSHVYLSANDSRTIDLDELPGVDPTMIGNLRGASLTGSYLTFDGTQASYEYNTGDANHPVLPVTLTSVSTAPFTSGIDAAEADNAAAFGIDGLTVNAATAGTLYNTNGIAVASGATMTAPAAGLYILSINGESFKVLLR